MIEFSPLPLKFTALMETEKHHYTFQVLSYEWRARGFIIKTDYLEPTHVSFMAHLTSSRIILEPIELGKLSQSILRAVYIALPKLIDNSGFEYSIKKSKGATEEAWKLHQEAVEQGKYSSIPYTNLAVDEYRQGFDRFIWLHERGISQYITETVGEFVKDLFKGSPPAAEKTGFFFVACKPNASNPNLITTPYNKEFIECLGKLLSSN